MRLFVFVGVCLCSVALVAQQTPSFRSSVDLLALDVNVVDQSHVPVADLTPEDFVVTVDYKPRKVVSAQFLRYDVRTAVARARAGVPGEGIAAVASVPAPARNVLIVIDEDSMEPGDGLLLRKEVDKFIDHLAPDDRVGAVTIPRTTADVTMTRNRAQVKKALAKVITGSERYRSQLFRIGLWEAFETERDASQIVAIQNRECRTPDLACRQEVAQELRNVLRQEHARGDRGLTALRELAAALATLEGPKTMILVSGGSPPPDAKSSLMYSRIGDQFALAQVTLFTLYVEQPEFGQSKYQASPTAALDRVIDREGLENATSAAGGTFMEAIGTWDQYFDRMVTEMSGSYLLGIEVEPADRNGRPHSVSVKVNRRGVDVRARTRYVIPRQK